MTTHCLNLFEITNLPSLNCRYRLFEVCGMRGNWAEDDTWAKNLNLLVKSLSYNTKAPVTLLHRSDIPHIALPSTQGLSTLEYTFTPDVLTLNPLAGDHELAFDRLTSETRPIAFSFLSFSLRSPYMGNHGFWRSGPSTFYVKTPLNRMDEAREADVYGGFGFRLLPLNGKIYVATRLNYRYVDRQWLIDRCANGNIDDYQTQRVLYHYGHRWFPVQFLGSTGLSVQEQKFVPKNGKPVTNVYDYTLAGTAPNPPNWITALDPHSPAINYRYTSNGDRRYGAAALCKLLLATDHPSVKGLHRHSIQPPEKRFSNISRVIEKYFQGAQLNDIPIQITSTPFCSPAKMFPVPAQRFGKDRVLQISSQAQPGGLSLRELGRRRVEHLQDKSAGALITSPFDAQYLLAPRGLQRDIAEDFLARFQQTVQQFTSSAYQMELVTYEDKEARTLKRQVDAITEACDRANITRGYGILILPSNAQPDLHNFIKRKLKDRIQFQCVQADNLSRFYGLRQQNGKSPG